MSDYPFAPIELETEQGSILWRTARMGIPTTSEFKRIVTASGKASTSQRPYVAELLAEWALAEEWSDFGGNEWTERGTALEPEARKWYEFQTGVEYRQTGLWYRNADRLVAGSPDGINDQGIPLELKCPAPKTHIMWLADGQLPRDHVVQVQGQMWVLGVEEAHFMSYCPNLPALLLQVESDWAIQRALDNEVPRFIEMMLKRREALREQGVESMLEAEMAAYQADAPDIVEQIAERTEAYAL